MEYTYLPSIPKPLLNDFITGRVIPFVGAGFSKNADIPMGLSMPDWNELGKLVANEIPDYEYDNNAIDALSYYEDLYSRAKLVELLMRELHFGEIQPGATYKAFCDLFTGTICTTNFDSLLEDSMTLLQRPISVVVTEDRLTVGSNNESKIVKLHGDFNHPDKMVITEHDYDVYLEQNPIFATYVANLFITNTMLLIGYSLDDNDFRGIWQIINSRLGSMAQPAYCITVGASPEKVAKYKRRNIRIINLEGEPQNYKTILCDLFIELKDYIDNEKDKTAKSIDERINEQMIIPAENNKLCFISCAMSRIAQLSALINPVLNNLGITPVRIDDMLMPGDNWIDISQTAIRKSRAAIIDISDSSNNVMLEFGLIKSTKQKQNILILCEEGTSIPVSLIDQPILTYTFDIAREKINNNFANELVEWSCRVFGVESAGCDNKREHAVFADAHRLFEKGEYSACIVSAFSELEYQIPLNFIDSGCEDYDSSPHILRYVRYLRKAQEGNIKNAHKLIELRNKIVHQGYVATQKEARDFLHFVEAVYECDRKTQG
ncbi:MAG: SIR2 family protein [Lachnospiraceae bacterium]|nr:SIR2 family protein [Lachnospiraceae bacterium]